MGARALALARGGPAVKCMADSSLHASPGDLELVRRTRSGDTDAFSELVRRHERMVYNLALRFVRDPVLAEDMAQDAFLKAFRLLSGFRGDSAFSTWMYRVTSSVCLNELKRRKRRAEEPMDALREGATPPLGHAPDGAAGQTRDSGGAPAAECEERDRAELVRRCVALLPDRYATIMTLYYLDGVAFEEIAAVMQIPVGTLKTWMFRARKQLKELVEKEIGRDAL